MSFSGLSFALWINAENHTTDKEPNFNGILTTTRRTVIDNIYHNNIGFRAQFIQTGGIVYWLFVNESILSENFFRTQRRQLKSQYLVSHRIELLARKWNENLQRWGNGE